VGLLVAVMLVISLQLYVVVGSRVGSLLTKVHPNGVNPGPGDDGPLQGGSVQGEAVGGSRSELTPVAVTEPKNVVSGLD
jgi:hypothetical protein